MFTDKKLTRERDDILRMAKDLPKVKRMEISKVLDRLIIKAQGLE